jgi:hypothetical protein
MLYAATGNLVEPMPPAPPSAASLQLVAIHFLVPLMANQNDLPGNLINVTSDDRTWNCVVVITEFIGAQLYSGALVTAIALRLFRGNQCPVKGPTKAKSKPEVP